jgi:hypothetical protein
MTRDEWMKKAVTMLDDAQSAWAWDCARALLPDLYEISELRAFDIDASEAGPVLYFSRGGEREVCVEFEQEDGPGEGHNVMVTAKGTGMTWRVSMRDKHMVTTLLRTAADFLTGAASRSQWKRIVFQRTPLRGEAG